MRPNPGGNEQITALAGILLIVFLAVEGATLLNLRALLTVHAFVGMLLLPIVALKLGSTGWRLARYYPRDARGSGHRGRPAQGELRRLAGRHLDPPPRAPGADARALPAHYPGLARRIGIVGLTLVA